jgi:hypothetical protein
VNQVESRAPVIGDIDGIAATFEASRQKVRDPFFVLYNENAHKQI